MSPPGLRRLPPAPEFPLRLGIVPFLNMFPLVHGLDRLAPHWAVISAPPSQLLALLEDGRCDMAMVPTAHYLEHRDKYQVLPGISITSHRKAGSVFILSDLPIAKVRSVELDANSGTSNALARLLLSGPLNRPAVHFMEEPAGREVSDTSVRHPETCVRIGDRALRERRNYEYGVDLAEAWNRWQGLPFVFALWAVRGEAPWQEIGAFLQALRDDNLDRLEEHLQKVPETLPEGIDLPAAADYLRRNICYDFGEEERKGLERFAELLNHPVAR